MRKDDATAVGKKGGLERDGAVQVLSNKNVPVVECCGSDFDENFIRPGGRGRDNLKVESIEYHNCCWGG